MDFADLEIRDGIRFPWNVWPSNRLDALRNVIPLGCLVTPLKGIDGLPVLPYGPVRCKCQGILNPYCSIDYSARTWICPFCNNRNPFPPQYAQMHEGHQPAELYPQYTAIEYTLPQSAQAPPAFLLVVDLCVHPDELKELKTSLKRIISMLPDYVLIGFMTFGAMVAIHELSSEIPKAYVFPGERNLSGSEVAKLLHLGLSRSQQTLPDQAPASRGQGVGRFLLPLSECEFLLETTIDELEVDEQPKRKGKRAVRGTGAAVALAVGLLENSVAASAAHIQLFTSGPATVGPGAVVGLDQAEALRSHRDFEKGSVKRFMESVKHYDQLADRMNRAGHSLDVFACCLDQVGLAELHPAVHYTGGAMLMSESYGHEHFQQSLTRFYEPGEDGYLQMGFNATVSLTCSQEVRIKGASGPCASLQRAGPNVSGNVMMAGGTDAWRLSTCTPRTTLAFFLEVGPVGNQRIPDGKLLHLQFATAFQHPSGQQRLRVVTSARSWADPRSEQVAAGFDQEAAMTMLARLTIFKILAKQALGSLCYVPIFIKNDTPLIIASGRRLMEEESGEVLRWLDQNLIKIAAKFAGYTKNQADTFQLPPNFSMLPQWVFNLRRSPFMQVFGHSPDETAFLRLMLDREAVAGSLAMIQPQLLAYGFGRPPQPAILDVQSIRADEILLLDTFLMIVVHYGSTVAQWRKAGYHTQPDHQAFRELLAAPLAEARELMKGRFPVPKLLETDQGGSQARFLLAKLNPSVTHTRPAAPAAAGSEVIFSEDVALDVFVEHLAKLAVVD